MPQQAGGKINPELDSPDIGCELATEYVRSLAAEIDMAGFEQVRSRCLDCLFRICLLDDREELRKLLLKLRDRTIREMFSEGKSEKELLRIFDIGVKSLRKALQPPKIVS